MKFHDKLNPKLWNKDKTLKDEVADKLEEIAEAFIEYLEINPDAIKDVVITGSSASYNYTPHSDLDLHLKVDYDMVHEDCPIVEGFLWSMKSQFNKDHDISIYGVPVELYAESIEGDTVHNGLYSLMNAEWIDEPQKIPPTDNDDAVLAKYNEIKEASDRIEDSEVAEELINKIYEMRKAGLKEVGEFSTENLAFKKLRDNGILDRLKQMKKEKIDKQLSLEPYNESLEQDVKELTKTDDYYKVDGSRVSIKNGFGSQVELMDLQNLGKKLEKKGYKVYCSNYYIDAKKNESIKESSIIDNFKEMANKIAADFKAEGYPKSNKYLLDFVDEATKKFSEENKGYLLRTSTDNGQAVITLCDMNGEDDGSIYQARINAYGKCKVRFTDLENSNYAYESLKEGLDKMVNKAMNEEDLKTIWKEQMKRDPIIDTPDGPIYLQPSEDGKSIEYGTMTNTGMLVDGSVEYDFDYSLDANLDTVYDEIRDYYELYLVPEEDRDQVVTDEKEDRLNSLFTEAAEGIYDPRTIVKAYNIQKDWIKSLGLGEDELAPEVMLFIIENKEIKDTKLIKRKDVYTYQPAENEYYLDMIRDTGWILTDYNLEPVQKLVDRWNDAKKWNNESIVKLKTFSDIINYKSILD